MCPTESSLMDSGRHIIRPRKLSVITAVADMSKTYDSLDVLINNTGIHLDLG